MMWLGPLAMAGLLALHFSWTPRGSWIKEARYVLGVTLVGLTADSLVHDLGGVLYPTSREAWPCLISPPWIACLWAGFATMPRFSMGWLGRHPAWVAVVFGAVGGPLGFFSGTRLGAIEPGWGMGTYVFLVVEYGVLMPLMIRFGVVKTGIRCRTPS